MANDESLDGSGRDESSTPNTAFCVHPWIHLRLQSTGEGQVCCRYRTNISKDGAPLSLRSHSFDAIWNSDEMRNVRRDMVAGKRVSGCAECYQEEDAGGVSMRTRDNSAWEQGWLNEGRASLDALMAQAVASEFRLPYLPVNIEIDTGSLCNLKCRMCHDGVSLAHRRRRRASELGERPVLDRAVSRPHAAGSSREPPPLVPCQGSGAGDSGGARPSEALVFHRRRAAPGTGSWRAAPALDRHRRVAERRAVVTNGTVAGSWLTMAGHFARLDVSISIDGYGAVYDYIRYPARWEKLKVNIPLFKALPNTSCGGAVTLQVYNALNVTDLFRYFDSIDLPFHAWPVHVPRYLSIDALPASVRRVAESRLREYADGDCRTSQRELVRGLAEQVRPKDEHFDPGLLRDCMLFTNDLDMSRGQRLADANGELIELLARAGYPWIDETVHARRDDHALISPAGR